MDEDGKIIVYNSGTGSVRDEDEMEICVGNVPGDKRTALFRIDVIEIPVSDPSKARIVSSPTVLPMRKLAHLLDYGKEVIMGMIHKIQKEQISVMI